MSHLGGSIPDGDEHTYTPDIWGWLLIAKNITSVIDIGCGHGFNPKWFLDMGCDAYGIEGDPEAVHSNQLPADRVIMHDYTTGPYVPDRQFDLGICTEFVEHVEQQYEANWIATARQCKWFLMCHAVPGQGGYHHVNEQASGYWIERLGWEGFEHQATMTMFFRATCVRKPAPWGRPTLMLFRRKDG